VLQTLLFIAVQYTSRQMALERIPTEALAETMRAVINATFLLLFTSLFAALVVENSTDDALTFTMVAFLYAALAIIAVSIRNTAATLRDSLESDALTARLNTRANQSRIEDFDQ